MDVRAVTETLFPTIQRYKDEQHVEIELRFGKFNGTMFDTNVGKHTFDTVMKGLNKYTGWEKMVGSEHDVVYRDSDNVRRSTDQATGEEEVVKKDRIKNNDDKRMTNTPSEMR